MIKSSRIKPYSMYIFAHICIHKHNAPHMCIYIEYWTVVLETKINFVENKPMMFTNYHLLMFTQTGALGLCAVNRLYLLILTLNLSLTLSLILTLSFYSTETLNTLSISLYPFPSPHLFKLHGPTFPTNYLHISYHKL